MEKIKVMLVDDDSDWRQGIHGFLFQDSQIELHICVSTIEECFEVLGNAHMDIVVMDIMLSHSEATGLEATRKITNCFPNIKVIIFSSLEREDEIILEAFKNGAIEYVNKLEFEQLPEIILEVMKMEKQLKRNLASNKTRLNLCKEDIRLQGMIKKGTNLVFPTLDTELSEEQLERVSAGLAWANVKCPHCGSLMIDLSKSGWGCRECSLI